MLWKMLVGEHITWKDDFVHIDEVAVRNTGLFVSLSYFLKSLDPII